MEFQESGDIYTRNAWVLPRRCSVEVSHKQMMLQITVIPMGKITKVLGTIKQTRSKHPKFSIRVLDKSYIFASIHELVIW